MTATTAYRNHKSRRKVGNMPNYIVTTRSWKGEETTACETEEEAWDAIGRMSFGGIYSVQSPVGLPVDDFVPF